MCFVSAHLHKACLPQSLPFLTASQINAASHQLAFYHGMTLVFLRIKEGNIVHLPFYQITDRLRRLYVLLTHFTHIWSFMVSDPAWPWAALEFMTHPSWQGKAVTTADTVVSFPSSPARRGLFLPSLCRLSYLFTKNLLLPGCCFFFLAYKSHFFLVALIFYLLY